MTIRLKLEDNLAELVDVLTDMHVKMIPLATKRAMRRASKTLAKESVKAVRERINLKVKDIRKKRIVMRVSLGGRDIAKYQIMVVIFDRPVPFSLLLRGSRLPRNQKGIAVKRRKKIRVTVRPGRRRVLESAFIAKGPKSGKFEVFKRAGTEKGPIKRQSAPSIHLDFLKKEFRRPIEKKTFLQLQKEFKREFKHLLRTAI